MAWACTREGYRVHRGKCWGWNCLVGKRQGGRGGDIMDVVREDMEAVGVTVKKIKQRGKWRDKILCGDP